MGKNYSNDSYKKSYSTEYVKSYKNGNTYPQAVPEIKPSDSIVKAEGQPRVRRVEKSQPEPKVEPANKLPSVDVAISKEQNIVEEVAHVKVKEVSFPTDSLVRKELPIKETKKESVKYVKPEIENKLGAEPLDYPIEYLHGKTYRNLHTQQEISEERARELLISEGFRPNKAHNIFAVIALSSIGIYVFGFFGVFMSIVFGLRLYKKEDAAYQKIDGFQKLTYSMSLTQEEGLLYKRQGILVIVIGVVGAVIKYL